jgi:DNA-binding HxlR family transcriptional regulator
VLREIEEEVVQNLVDSTLFYSSSPIFRTILGYFLTRKTLTQEILKELTGLSAGKISQELNKLHKMGFLERTRKSMTEPYFYSMESIDIAFINDAINVLNTSLEWEARLIQIYHDLDNNEDKMNYLNGYREIVKFLKFVMPLMAYTKGQKKEMLELREEFKKKVINLNT